MGEALHQSTVRVACGLAFAGVVAVAFGGQAFGEYISGYLIEKSLSVDNVFVWAMLFTSMAIPLKLQSGSACRARRERNSACPSLVQFTRRWDVRAC